MTISLALFARSEITNKSGEEMRNGTAAIAHVESAQDAKKVDRDIILRFMYVLFNRFCVRKMGGPKYLLAERRKMAFQLS